MMVVTKQSSQAQKVTLMYESNERIIKHKVGLLNLAEELGNVSQACKVMGVSRDTFYRYKSVVEDGGVEALLDKSRRKPNLKNRVDEQVEAAVLAYAIEQPAHGQVRVSNELRKRGVFVSPSGVRSIWLRNGLANFKQRLKALEAHVAETGTILTDSQVAALERKAQDDEACGEIETPITAADLLNDRVLPLFEEHDLPLLRILTDRGAEYCGKAESHDYQLYLAINGIDHTKTKAKSPQTNGICERFHKTVLQEFYQVAFRKTVFKTIDDLQKELDLWIDHYNTERTHQGKMCCGRTPMETLIDGKQVWLDKKIDQT